MRPLKKSLSFSQGKWWLSMALANWRQTRLLSPRKVRGWGHITKLQTIQSYTQTGPKIGGVTNPFVICDLGKLCKTYQSYLLEAFVVLQRGYFSASHEHVTDEHSYSIQFKDSQRSFSIGLLAQTALAMRTFFSSKGAFKKSRPGFSCLCSSEKRNPVQSFSGHESCGKNSLMISRSVHLVRTHAVLTTFEI